MDTFKSLISAPSPAGNLTPNNKPSLPLLINLDYCNRYRPLFDRATFQADINNTNEEIIEYFPLEVSSQYKRVVQTSFLVGSIGFALFCQRIGILKSVLGEKSWKMFSLKMISILLPVYLWQQFLPLAEEEQISMLYKSMSSPYRNYKFTGDILFLNKNIILEGEGFLESEEISSNKATLN